MQVKWTELKNIGEYFQLTIEGDVTPKDIFNIVKNNEIFNTIIIKSYDLEKNNFMPLANKFKEAGIDYKVLDYGIQVSKGYFDCIFENTDFGMSQDSYELIQSENIKIRSFSDLIVTYENIPDLVVKSKSKKLLDLIIEVLQ